MTNPISAEFPHEKTFKARRRTIWIDAETDDALQVAARQQDRSVSWLVNLAIKRALAEKEGK